jgi:hypothetical protein
VGDPVQQMMISTALGRVRVQVHGAGKPMLFWPSLLMTGDMWAAQADATPKRSASWSLLTPGLLRPLGLTS